MHQLKLDELSSLCFKWLFLKMSMQRVLVYSGSVNAYLKGQFQVT